jgi:hypothetical protein
MGAHSREAHDGTRTRDLFLTKEVLCRLSYVSARLREPPLDSLGQGALIPTATEADFSHPNARLTGLLRPAAFLQARQEGIEPPTAGFGDRCSTN